jgi:hypothetical protein
MRVTTLSLLALLVGCAPPGARPEEAGSFSAQAATPSEPVAGIGLVSRDPIVLEIPVASRAASPERVPISGPWRLIGASHGIRAYEAPLPVRPRALYYERAPEGMELFHGEHTWRYGAGPWDDDRPGSWKVDADSVTVHCAGGKTYRGQALIGADGVKSVVRQQFVGDPARVTGHVVYRAVVDKKDFPVDLQWNAASIWVGPNCHLVHYPLRGGEQYNVVVTFNSRQQEEWGITEGSKEEVQSYFQGISPKARQLIDLPKSWKRWATADRDPIGQWSYGRVTLLGDAAHPTTQYMAQGACMAMEDGVTLGEALRVHANDWTRALDLYQRSRVARTARIVLSSREMGRIYHAKGVERLVRNDLWRGRAPERFYDAMAWLYGWNVDNCLATPH